MLMMKVTMETINAATAFFSSLLSATIASTSAIGQRMIPKKNKPIPDSTKLVVVSPLL